MKRQVLYRLVIAPALVFISTSAVATSTMGQVLTPPRVFKAQDLKRIKIEGVVTDQKKYSFDVKTEGQSYVIKPGRNSIFTLRMNKPIFDFNNNRVRVQKLVSMLEPELAETIDSFGRVTYNLPDKLYVISRFDNEQQMRRIMESRVKRINNYLLTSKNSGDLHPAKKQLLIAGQLLPGTEGTVANLEIDDESYSVRLGHRRASMTGFSISDMKPLDTEVFIWGHLVDDNTISAHRIEFRPIATKANETKVLNKSGDQNSPNK